MTIHGRAAGLVAMTVRVAGGDISVRTGDVLCVCEDALRRTAVKGPASSQEVEDDGVIVNEPEGSGNSSDLNGRPHTDVQVCGMGLRRNGRQKHMYWRIVNGLFVGF